MQLLVSESQVEMLQAELIELEREEDADDGAQGDNEEIDQQSILVMKQISTLDKNGSALKELVENCQFKKLAGMSEKARMRLKDQLKKQKEENNNIQAAVGVMKKEELEQTKRADEDHRMIQKAQEEEIRIAEDRIHSAEL